MQLTVPNFELDCCGLRVSGSIRLSGGTEWARFDGLGSTEWARFDWALFDGLDWMGCHSNMLNYRKCSVMVTTILATKFTSIINLMVHMVNMHVK